MSADTRPMSEQARGFKVRPNGAERYARRHQQVMAMRLQNPNLRSDQKARLIAAMQNLRTMQRSNVR